MSPRTQPIPLVGDSYADETRPWSMQDTVNYLPCAAEVEGTRSSDELKTPPGLKPFLEIPPTPNGENPPIPSPPVRRTHNAEGKLFAVIGTMMYRVSNAGIAIPVGEVPGIGRVVMAHNQISLGNEILAVNGQAGYVYNTVTEAFGRITDPGYPGSATAVFIDGYLVQIEPQGRYAFNSEPAAATQYNTLDRFTSEVSPDRLVAPAVFNNKLLLLSKSTSEFFENTGASQQPFRSTRVTFDKGCAGPYAVAHADTTVFFLGSDGMFYRVEGYRPVRISKRPLEQAIRGLNWAQAFAEVWEDAGFTVIYWTFPDGGHTWGYNTADGRWHRRESYGLNRWRVNTMTRWNDLWVAGDFQTGRLWNVAWGYNLEGDQEFISERTLAVIHDNQNLVLIPRVEVVMDTGQEETVAIPFPAQPEGPTIEGDAPNSVIGAEYEFAYTVTEGDAPIETVAIVSGSLPPGWTMDNDGIITGVATEGGTFEWTARVTDTNGLWDEVDDEAAILAEQWWGSYPGFFDEMIVSNTDALTWEAATVNETDNITVHLGPVQFGDRVMFAQDGSISTAAYFADAEFVASGLSVTQEVVPDFISRALYIDDIAFIIRRDDLPSMYSQDLGATWDECFAPAAGEADDINKVGDVWVTHNTTIDSAFYYSEQEVPTTWTEGASAGNGHKLIASNGTVAVSFDNVNTCRRTTDGITWANITVTGHDVTGTNGGDCIAIGNVFLFSRTAGNPASLMRSADAGLTWAPVTVVEQDNSVRRFVRSDSGRIVASMSGGSNIYYSDDVGLTWTPVDVGQNQARVAPIRLSA